MDSYQRRLKRHLAAYRQTRLGLPRDEMGTYGHRGGEPKHYGHILPARLKWLNVPEPFRREIRAQVETTGIKLHDGFGHLNSSQALAIAFFWPYATYAPGTLARALGVPAIEQLEFEHVADAREGTNVDVSWCNDHARIYCEVKLSEQEFGGARDDVRHQRKLAEHYRPVLAGIVDPTCLETKRFFRDYQILRNLWLAARPGHERDEVMFLLPAANRRPNAQLEALLPVVAPRLRERVRVVALEEVLERLMREGEALAWYARILAEKYAPN